MTSYVKLSVLMLASFLLPSNVWAETHLSEQQLTDFAKQYFQRWSATQQPKASIKDIDNYLALLTDDVGHQHLPYDADDARNNLGKANMRKGMKYYLGGHTAYQSSLKDVVVGYDVVIIKYHTQESGIHPQTKQTLSFDYDTTEVLEIENGKVSVIRKYSE